NIYEGETTYEIDGKCVETVAEADVLIKDSPSPASDSASCESPSAHSELIAVAFSEKDPHELLSADENRQPNEYQRWRHRIHEDAPRVLQLFRDEYYEILRELDSTSALYTRDSHIHEAIEIAISSGHSREGILSKLTEHVFNDLLLSFPDGRFSDSVRDSPWYKDILRGLENDIISQNVY
ncbi:hypothetical protein M422DRAFT_256952, partial [Sphaerobolus stellatus SS14]